MCLLNQEANAATEIDKKKIVNERSAHQTMRSGRPSKDTSTLPWFWPRSLFYHGVSAPAYVFTKVSSCKNGYLLKQEANAATEVEKKKEKGDQE